MLEDRWLMPLMIQLRETSPAFLRQLTTEPDEVAEAILERLQGAKSLRHRLTKQGVADHEAEDQAFQALIAGPVEPPVLEEEESPETLLPVEAMDDSEFNRLIEVLKSVPVET
jgi:hypothetical protein